MADRLNGGVWFRLEPIAEENETNFECSKIGGSPCFPLDFLEQHSLYDDLFVAQLNLAELQIPNLPNEGFLYFFLNVEEYPYQAKVVFNNAPVEEVFVLINEDFEDFGDPSAYQIIPIEGKDEQQTGLGICTEFDPNLDLDCVIDTADNLNLLELDSLSLPYGVLTLGQPDGWYLFVISKKDLEKGDFSNVQFVAYGS